MPAAALRRLVSATLMLVAVSACTGTQAPTTAPSASPSKTYIADIDVGGRTLHIVCDGPTDSGRPTVIFEHGLGGDYRQWRDVTGGLEATERVCAYDRAGMGKSEPGPGPWTTADQVEDLHALLDGAAIAPPYVLVGFSVGGWNVMVYSDRYPDEVAGAVLVDVRSPAGSARWLAELPPEVAGESDALHGNREEFTTFEADPTLNPEELYLAASASQAGAVAGLGDRPLEILWASDTSTLWEGLDPDLAARLDAVSMELRKEMEGLSTDSHATLVDAPHEIPAEQPGAVIDAIHAVLDRIPG